MMQRGRVLEAVSLMIDAGGHQRATLMMKSLNESVVETVEPRPMLSLLARLGSTVERDPELLLLRAGAHRADRARRRVDRRHRPRRGALVYGAAPGAATGRDRVGAGPA